MRVIAGTARRLPLKTPAGTDTRPTTDRIKETLFNILQPDLYGCRFLDLFAGSGGIGIEALSRGAVSAVFVDNSREAVGCIRENLQFTRLAERARVMACDYSTALRNLGEEKKPFDIIFADPPYRAGIEYEILRLVRDAGLAREETVIIIEAQLRTDLTEAESYGFRVVREKKYKTNKHIFLSADRSEYDNSDLSGEL